MSSAINTGGPAFPVPLNQGESFQGHGPADGMTKREAFAMAALQGLCANPGGPFQANPMRGWGIVNCTIDQLADECLALADALLSKAGAA